MRKGLFPFFGCLTLLLASCGIASNPFTRRSEPKDDSGNPVSWNNASATEGFVFEDRGGEIWLCDYVEESEDIDLPNYIDGKPVVGIVDGGFSNRPFFSVAFSANIRDVGDYAFSGCDRLEKLIFNEGLEVICNYAFADCKSLYNVTLPASVSFVGEFAFSGCNSLEWVYVAQDNPYLYSSVGDMELNGIFSRNSDGLIVGCRSTQIPDRCKEIYGGAFSGKDIGGSLYLPNFLSAIGTEAFAHCRSLTEIHIPSSVNSIGSNAFVDCPLLTIFLGNGNLLGEQFDWNPDGCPIIDNSVEIHFEPVNIKFATETDGLYLHFMFSFQNAEYNEVVAAGLEGRWIDFVQWQEQPMELSFFDGGYSGAMRYINVAAKVSDFDPGSRYFRFNWPNNEMDFALSAVDDVCDYGGRTYHLDSANGYCGETVLLHIDEIGSDPVISLGNLGLSKERFGVSFYAKFECSCSFERAIKLQWESVALTEKTSGTTITFSTSPFDYGWPYFHLDLSSVPSGEYTLRITYAGYSGQSVALCTTVDQVSDVAFGKNVYQMVADSATGVVSININAPYSLAQSQDGKNLYIQTAADECMIVSSFDESSDLVVPELINGFSVTAIGDEAFSNQWDSLVNLTIPGCVREIGRHAFSGCHRLRTISFSEGLTSIGQGAFDSCSSLECIDIPASVIDICDAAFACCDSMQYARFLSPVPPTGMEDDIFAGTWDRSEFIIYVPSAGVAAYKELNLHFWQENGISHIVGY